MALLMITCQLCIMMPHHSQAGLQINTGLNIINIILKPFKADGRSVTMMPKNRDYFDLIGNMNVIPAGDMNYINILYSYDESDVDVNSCTCNELYISGFQNQAINGHYIKQQTIHNSRKKFFICIYNICIYNST